MDVAAELTRGLIRFGPPLLGVLTFIETSTVLGLFVPAGVAFLLACFLSTQGTLPLVPVIVWALAGAVSGDSVGYWVGRRSSAEFRSHRGLMGRAFTRVGPKKLALLARSPFYAVSLARVISFVRTLAPVAAGRAGLTYARFLAYNSVGIVLWAVTYVAVGTLAGESWRRASQYVGGLWAVVILLAVAIGVWLKRREGPGAPGQPRSARPLSIGLTGNAASGKSTVAGLWRGQGVPVVDADALSREAVVNGSEGLAAVVEEFGSDVLAEDGSLDRDALRSVVFADEDKRLRLEAILHPRIARLRDEWVTARASEGHALVVSEVPLLFEAGLASAFDAIVVVHAPRAVSYERLVELRGLTPDEANGILDAQMPSEKKKERANYVIHNLGTKGDLEDSAMHTLGTLRARAAAESTVPRA